MRDHDASPADTIGQLLRYGTVESVDLATGKARIRIGDIVTQPVRWLHGASGGTSSWSPPSAGEQVLLLAPEGDIEGAIALRGVHSNAHPPAGNTTRELTRYADGAVLAYDPAAHKLEAVLPGGATVAIVAPGGVTLEADVRISGDLQVDGKVTADGEVQGNGIKLSQHKHTGVATGSALSGAPQ